MYADRTLEDDTEDELRWEAAAERRRNARLRHWCSECLGFTGSGSPCAPDEDEQEEEQ